MSFHKQEFHETKRERKFYEDKKQKALRYIDHTRAEWFDTVMTHERMVRKLAVIKKMVNDI